MQGLDVLKVLKEKDEDALIIFMTAYESVIEDLPVWPFFWRRRMSAKDEAGGRMRDRDRVYGQHAYRFSRLHGGGVPVEVACCIKTT